MVLPIHRRTQEKYYQDHNNFIKKQKPAIEQSWGKKFNELEIGIQTQWECLWHWPPWLFNDIAGYLEIGMDGGIYMTANIYLKPRYLPPTHWYRAYKGKYFTTLERQYILHANEVHKRSVDIKDNTSFVMECEAMIQDAKRILMDTNKNLHIWQLSYSLECLDFVKAYSELKER